jgi:hypothetical protein
MNEASEARTRTHVVDLERIFALRVVMVFSLRLGFDG